MGIPGGFWVVGVGGCGANCLSYLRSRRPSRARVKTGVVTSAPDSVAAGFADATLEIEPQRYGTAKRSPWRNRTVRRVGNSRDACEPLLADETTQFVTWFEENMRDAVFCAVIGGIGGHTSSVCLPAAVSTLAKMNIPHAVFCVLPFRFENRGERVVKLIAEIDRADALSNTILLENDRLFEISDGKEGFEKAFGIVDEAILMFVQGFVRKYVHGSTSDGGAEENFDRAISFPGKDYADRVATRFGLEARTMDGSSNRG